MAFKVKTCVMIDPLKALIATCLNDSANYNSAIIIIMLSFRFEGHCKIMYQLNN